MSRIVGRRWISAAVLVLLLTGVTAIPALAECTTPRDCGDEAPPANEPLTFGVAFTARVAEVSDDVDPPPPDTSPYQVHIELEVDRVFRGTMPARISWNEYRVYWGTFIGKRLNVGDRLFVAAETYWRGNITNPFDGDIVIWQRTRGRWAFAPRLLTHSDNRDFYPAAARAADSLADILAVVRAAGLPDTSTAAVPLASVRPDSRPVLGMAAVVGFILALWRQPMTGRRRRAVLAGCAPRCP